MRVRAALPVAPADYRRGSTATLAAVPAEQIATNLALINWTVLAGLAVGSFAVVVAGPAAHRRRPRASSRSPPLCAAGFGLLAYLSDAGAARRPRVHARS